MTPDGNIKSAVDIYNYGKNWCPWSTAYPKYCNKK
jgi:hypothetical protein